MLTRVVLPLLPDAYDTAKMLCEKYYLAAPELKIEEFNSKRIFRLCAVIHPSLHLTISPCNLSHRRNTVYSITESIWSLWVLLGEYKFSPIMITMSTVSLTSKELVLCVCLYVCFILSHPFLSFPPVKAPKKPIQVVYVPSHLFHMLFELFKVSSSVNLTSSAAL